MIVTLEEMREHLGITDTLGTADDALIERQIKAAEAFMDRQLGFKMVERFEPDGDVPDDLKEGIRHLAAHFYENREATLVGVNAQALPFGLQDTINSHRDWTF